MTRYAMSHSDHTFSAGEGIVPLTEEEAREWLEEHGDTDDYIAAFGEPPEA